MPVGYEGSWAAPDRHTSWNGDWELVGSEARATWTGAPTAALRGRVTLERYGSAPAVVALPALPALDRRGVLWELRRAILAGEQPETSGADNLTSLAAVLALARSTETGAPVATAGAADVTVAVGIDVGTTGVKAVAIASGRGGRRPRGAQLPAVDAAARIRPSRIPRTGGARRRAALAEVAAGREVCGIGLSGQMHGLVCLDAADEVIRPAILWNDQRTGAECDEIEARIGLDRLIALTGNRALTGFTAPKLLWLRSHEPDSYARIARVMLPKDYVRLRLSGEWATDVADASGTLLLDVARRDWSSDVLDALRAARRLAPAAARVARGQRAHDR